MAATYGKRTKPKGMTAPQMKYLAKLLRLAGEPWDPSLSCMEASARIKALREQLGFADSSR